MSDYLWCDWFAQQGAEARKRKKLARANAGGASRANGIATEATSSIQEEQGAGRSPSAKSTKQENGAPDADSSTKVISAAKSGTLNSGASDGGKFASGTVTENPPERLAESARRGGSASDDEDSDLDDDRWECPPNPFVAVDCHKHWFHCANILIVLSECLMYISRNFGKIILTPSIPLLSTANIF